MSIEKALADLQASVDELNSSIQSILATGKTRAAEKDAAAEKPSRSRAAEKEEAEDEKPASRRGRPKKDDADEKPASSRSKKVTAKTISEAASKFLDSARNDREYDDFRDELVKIVEHYGADKLTEIDDEHLPEVLELITDLTDGKELQLPRRRGRDVV